MIWQNPFAWLGLLALGVPLLIHLLARRRSRVLPFPTIQFIAASALPPRRRARLTDVPLLALRLAMLAVAVAALAQPLLLTADRTERVGRVVARAIVLDTSASMQRMTSTGARAGDVARSTAQQLADDAPSSVVIRTSSPRRALAGAIGWLETQPGRHEIAIVSDFQLGTLDAMDIAGIPPRAGVLLERVDVTASPLVHTFRDAGQETMAHIVLWPDRTDVEWTARPVVHGPAQLTVLAGPREQDLVQADIAAVRSIGVPAADSAQPITIVLPRHEQRAQLMRSTRPVDRPWMGDIVARLHEVSAIERAAASDDGLVLFSSVHAGTVESAALLAAAARAAAPAAHTSELEPATLTDAELDSWRRAAADAVVIDRRITNDVSDGRWLWLVVLALLGAEAMIRRGRARKLAA